MTTFADPAPPAPVLTDPPKNKDYVVRGRYALPDPDTGQDKTWTRVTNMDVISDKYSVQEWEKRMVVKGMALDPALVAQASILDVTRDKDPLNKLAWRAKEKAGGSSGAGMGTALHTVTERYDRGEDVDAGVFGKELDAYRATLAAEGLTMDHRYLERIICVPELGCAGRLDKLMRLPGTGPITHQVGDLKSQKSMEFGGLGMAIQLSIYAHAYAVWNEDTETWEDPPAIDQVLATVIWLPVGVGECELYDVDLVYGWRWAKVAHEIREGRKHKPVTRREPTAVEAARDYNNPSQAMIDEIGRGAPADDAPTDSLAALGQAMGNARRAGAPPFDQAAADTSSRPNLEDPRTMLPAIVATVQASRLETWRTTFMTASSLDELMTTAQYAREAFGGQLPAELKALGAELRTKLEAPVTDTVGTRIMRWGLRFHTAKSLEELTALGLEAAADHGGTLPEALKKLGAELRLQFQVQGAVQAAEAVNLDTVP